MKLYKNNQNSNDYDRQIQLFQIADNLTNKFTKDFDAVDEMLVSLLAISPIKLSLEMISKVLSISKKLIEEVVLKQYNNHLIVFETNENEESVYYVLCDELISKMIMHN